MKTLNNDRHLLITILLMIATMISRLLGFIRVAVIGAVFGATGSADVLNLVFSIPNNLRKLLGEGALSSAFIPTLSRAHAEDSTGLQARGMLRNIIGFQLVIFAPFLLLVTLFPHQILFFLLRFPDSQKQLLAGNVFRLLIHYALFISLSAVFMSILHSHQRFILAAISPWIFSISVISSIYFLHSHFGIYAMAVGLLVGGIAQMCILLCSVKQLNYIILPAFSFKDAAFLSILRKWVPILLTSSVFAVNQQIAFFFASGLQDGSGSALSNALVFWQLPFGIFSVSITTVLFSVMSREVAHGNVSAAKTAFTNGIRQLLFLLLPAGTILIVLGKEIITVALQRGLFEYKDTILTAKVLAGYSPGLFTVAAFVLTQRFFYAQNNHTKPIFAAFLVVTIDILLSIILKRTALQVIGLSIANTVAFSVGFILLLAMTKIPFRQWKHIITAFWKSAFVSLLVFTLISFLRMILDNNGLLVSNISDLTAFIRLSILCISALFCILVSYFILGIRPASLLIKGEKI